MLIPLHPWNVSPTEAVKIQRDMREKVRLEPLFDSVQYVAGADISFDRGSDVFHAGIVILRLPSLQVCGHSLVTTKSTFPYVPGLLSFREMPSLLEAWDQLPTKPDVVVLDGHGIAHPRRLGIASHFGLWVNKPTIGCAKKMLVGMHETLATEAKSHALIHDNQEIIGVALRSRENVNPIYISPGHLTNLESALSVVSACLTRYRLPEVTRQAHQLVNQLRRGEVQPGVRLYQEM
ncbi:deoxyribonuclease V [Tunicatimonas pelagia]|uniref:deoxyribonuclease V n=1 Tax=Tunicatimonas pelagia TaxID=931531 RepID=UPI0026659975|nr:deoxyribonuclease V [Tunicatimonas pelagia]WKN41771.1 deoxyribonuclease V [Tunicatimonas pelagia]